MSVHRTLKRLLALVLRPRLDRELENEILAHLELAERDAVARGLSPAGGPPGGSPPLWRN